MTALCEVCGRVKDDGVGSGDSCGRERFGTDTESCLRLGYTRALAERDGSRLALDASEHNRVKDNAHLIAERDEARGAAEEHASKAAADRKLADEWMNARIRDRQWSARWKRAAKGSRRPRTMCGALFRPRDPGLLDGCVGWCTLPSSHVEPHNVDLKTWEPIGAEGHPYPTPSKEGA